MITTFKQLKDASKLDSGISRLELGADISIDDNLFIPSGKTVLHNGYKFLKGLSAAATSTADTTISAAAYGAPTTKNALLNSPFQELPGLVTFTVASSAGYTPGGFAFITGSSAAEYNGQWVVASVPDSTHVVLHLHTALFNTPNTSASATDPMGQYHFTARNTFTGTAKMTPGVGPYTISAHASEDGGTHTRVTISSTAGVLPGSYVTITGGSIAGYQGRKEVLSVVTSTELKLDMAYVSGGLGSPSLQPGMPFATISAVTSVARPGGNFNNGNVTKIKFAPALELSAGATVTIRNSGVAALNGTWRVLYNAGVAGPYRNDLVEPVSPFAHYSEIILDLPYPGALSGTPVVSSAFVIMDTDPATTTREALYRGFAPGDIQASTSQVYPEWWGLIPGHHDVAINSAIRSFRTGVSGVHVSLAGGSYHVSAPLDLRGTASRLVGQGNTISHIVGTPNWAPPLWEHTTVFTDFSSTSSNRVDTKPAVALTPSLANTTVELNSHSSLIWMGSELPNGVQSFRTGVSSVYVNGYYTTWANPDKHISLISSTGYVEECSFIRDVMLEGFSGFGVGFHNAYDGVAVINGLVLDHFWILGALRRHSIPIFIPTHAVNCTVSNGTIDVHLQGPDSIEGTKPYKADWAMVGLAAGGLHTTIDNIHIEGVGVGILAFDDNEASGMTISNVDVNGMMDHGMIHSDSPRVIGPAPATATDQYNIAIATLPIRRAWLTAKGVEITTAVPHGLSTRSYGVEISGVSTQVNGTYRVTVLSEDRFLLDGTDAYSAVSYTSGGTVGWTNSAAGWDATIGYRAVYLRRYGVALLIGTRPTFYAYAYGGNLNSSVTVTNLCGRTSGRYLLRDIVYDKHISLFEDFGNDKNPNANTRTLNSYTRTGVYAARGPFPYPEGNGDPFLFQNDIVSASNTTPVVIKTRKPCGLSGSTNMVYIKDVVGSTTANGYFFVTPNGTLNDEFTLNDSVAGGAGTGGTVLRMSRGTDLGINGATNASPIVITTVSPHGISTSARVLIYGITGNTAANGMHTAIYDTATTLKLMDTTGNGTFGGTGGLIPNINLLPGVPISSISIAASAVVTTSQKHGLINTPTLMKISGCSSPSANGTWGIEIIDDTRFYLKSGASYVNSFSWGSPMGGTIVANSGYQALSFVEDPTLSTYRTFHTDPF